MTRTKSIYLALVALLLSPMAANAALIEIAATNFSGSFTDFTIVFDDDGDGILQFGELLSFSGFEEVSGAMRVYDTLIGIPDVLGVSMQGGYTGGLDGDFWWVTPVTSNSFDGDGWFQSRWSYVSSPTTASVPEPGTLALLGIGLFGMGLSRRRKKV